MDWKSEEVKNKISIITKKLSSELGLVVFFNAGNGIFTAKPWAMDESGIVNFISTIKNLFAENLPTANLESFTIIRDYLIFNFSFSQGRQRATKVLPPKIPKNFYIFRWSNRSTPQGISAPIYVVANNLDEAEKLVAKEDNVIAGPDNNWTGYKCIQTIALDSSKNLSLLLQ